MNVFDELERDHYEVKYFIEKDWDQAGAYSCYEKIAAGHLVSKNGEELFELVGLKYPTEEEFKSHEFDAEQFDKDFNYMLSRIESMGIKHIIDETSWYGYGFYEFSL